MVIELQAEPIKGGWRCRFFTDCGSGGADGKSRILAVEGAVTMALRGITRTLENGDLALNDVFPLDLKEAVLGAGRGTG